MKRLLVLLILLPTLSCTPSRSNGDDDDDADSDWNVEVANDSGVGIDTLQQRPCGSDDPEDWNEVPLDPDGIPTGETHRMLMPAPGCFDFSGEGGGCFAEGTTGPMQLGDQVTWTIQEVDLTCAG